MATQTYEAYTFAPTIIPLTAFAREKFKMADEKVSTTVKESLALDIDKQKEFEKKINEMKDKVRGIYLLDISGCCVTK